MTATHLARTYVREEGDAPEQGDVGEEEGTVGAADQRHALMVDPPDPDDQERDTVGGVARLAVRARQRGTVMSDGSKR